MELFEGVKGLSNTDQCHKKKVVGISN